MPILCGTLHVLVKKKKRKKNVQQKFIVIRVSTRTYYYRYIGKMCGRYF